MLSAEEILKKTELFFALSDLELGEVAGSGRVKKVKKEEIIFSQGQEAVGAYVIGSGKVKIYKLGQDGRQHILHIYGPGHMFAEAAMFHGRTYPAFAEAIEDSELFYLSKERFLYVIEKNPKLVLKILGYQALKLREFATKIEALSLKEVGPRLARYLIELLEDVKDKDKKLCVKLPMNKTQLASYLGTISETLSRTLAIFKKRNYIEEKDHTIIIKDYQKLKDLAES